MHPLLCGVTAWPLQGCRSACRQCMLALALMVLQLYKLWTLILMAPLHMLLAHACAGSGPLLAA